MRKIWLLLLIFVQILVLAYTVTVVCRGCRGDNDVTLRYDDNVVYLKAGIPVSIYLSGESNLEIYPSFGREYGCTLPEIITVNSTSTIEIFYSMNSATITVTSTPSNAEIYLISGDLKVPIGETPLVKEVPLVPFKLVVKKPGYYPEKIEINPAVKDLYSVDLTPKNLIKIVTSIPASLVVNDSIPVETPYSKVFEPGKYELKFYVKGVLVSSTELTVTEDTTPSTLFFNLPNVYSLEIKTKPEIAFAKVDGRTYRTPISLNMIEGDYDVECWIPGFESERKRVYLYDDRSIRCDLKRIYHTVGFSTQVYLKIDGTPAGTSNEFRVPEGIHLFEAFSNGRKWIWLRNVDSDSFVFVPKSGGTLMVPDPGIVEIDGVKFLSPLAFPISEGVHEIAFRRIGERFFIRKRIKITDGKIFIFPDGKHRVLFVFSDVPVVRFLAETEDGTKRFTTPAVLKLKGKVRITPLEGCKIEGVHEIEVKDLYGVLKINTSCGVK